MDGVTYFLRLTPIPLAIFNVIFLVPDDALAADDVLLGLTLLKQCAIDTKKMLENITTTLMVLTVPIFNHKSQIGEWGKFDVL